MGARIGPLSNIRDIKPPIQPHDATIHLKPRAVAHLAFYHVTGSEPGIN